MDFLAALPAHIADKLQQQSQSGPGMALSSSDYQQMRCDVLNRDADRLEDGYDCKVCDNRGFTYFPAPGDTIVCRDCKCKAARESMRRIRSSGLAEAMELYTLANYRADSVWQAEIKRQAENYIADPQGWFFAGGQVGSGKTHVCTAVVGALMQQGKSARYMRWRSKQL